MGKSFYDGMQPDDETKLQRLLCDEKDDADYDEDDMDYRKKREVENDK